MTLACVGHNARPQRVRGGSGSHAYHVQFSDVALYSWLERLGLSPRKSFVLGKIDVPEQHLLALTRGLLDGDGTVANYTHLPTKRKYPNYRYERLFVRFHSASPRHLDCLRDRLLHFGLHGSLGPRRSRKMTMYVLEYGKNACASAASPSVPDGSRAQARTQVGNLEALSREELCADGGIRTHTFWYLKPVPLPLGYVGGARPTNNSTVLYSALIVRTY